MKKERGILLCAGVIAQKNQNAGINQRQSQNQTENKHVTETYQKYLHEKMRKRVVNDEEEKRKKITKR